MICPVQTRCGGCPTLHLDRPTELAEKVASVHRSFERVGLPNVPQACTVGYNRTGYRNRLRMKVVEGKAALFNQAKEQGCIALRPELWDAVAALRKITHADSTLLSGVAHLEVRVDDNARIGLSIVALDSFEADASDQSRSRLQAKLGSAWLLADRAATMQPTLRYDLAPSVVNDVPIDAFVQVNSEVNRLLISHVRNTVSNEECMTFIDLFCGAGNLTLPLITAGLSGTAVEQNGSGPAALIKQATEQPLTVLTGDVHDRLRDVAPADLLISNPPRSGIKTNHQTIASLVSKTMICVGCEPEALAFDIAQLTKFGLKVVEIQTFDMFPGTDHIETAVTLKRKES